MTHPPVTGRAHSPLSVAVVGAGPAGASAAITLARRGHRVTLVDKASFPRDKCCGDGLTATALRELEDLGFNPGPLPSWQAVETVNLRSPSGRVVELALPADGTYAAVTPRRDLDAALVDLAAHHGVELALGRVATAVEPAGAGVVLTIGAGDGRESTTLDCDYVVAADGAWSPVRKALGLSEAGYLGEWHAFRRYYSATGPAARRMWVWFEPDLLPGYAWSFPLPGNRVNIGFGVVRDGDYQASAMAELWPDLLSRPHIAEVLGPDAHPDGPYRAWPIPARVWRAPLSALGGRVLFAGDAACATDPLTGEGIAQALTTGRLAAAAAAGAGAGQAEQAGRTYAEAVGRELFADHRLAKLLGRGLSHRKGARSAIWAAGINDFTRRNFARWLFEDYPRALVLTPRRWAPGALSNPGAYRSA